MHFTLKNHLLECALWNLLMFEMSGDKICQNFFPLLNIQSKPVRSRNNWTKEIDRSISDNVRDCARKASGLNFQMLPKCSQYTPRKYSCNINESTLGTYLAATWLAVRNRCKANYSRVITDLTDADIIRRSRISRIRRPVDISPRLSRKFVLWTFLFFFLFLQFK